MTPVSRLARSALLALCIPACAGGPELALAGDTGFEISSQGGMPTPCGLGDDQSYRVDFATRSVYGKRPAEACGKVREETVVVSDTEIQTLKNRVAGLRVVESDACWEDVPVRIVRFVRAHGTVDSVEVEGTVCSDDAREVIESDGYYTLLDAMRALVTR